IPFLRDAGAGPVTYLRHQGIYGYSRKFLLQFVKWKPTPLEKAEQLEQLRALENGAKIRVLITKSVSMGVDTPEDAQMVSALLERKPALLERKPAPLKPKPEFQRRKSVLLKRN